VSIVDSASHYLSPSILAFVRAAELKSFSAAARELGLSPSGVSVSISRLEQRLGVRLMVRTSKSVELTKEGETFFATCCSLLESFENLSFHSEAPEVEGLLRIQVASEEVQDDVVGALARFQQLHPQVELDVTVDSSHRLLANDSVDMAVSSVEGRDSDHVATVLCYLDYIICASPAYLRHNRTPNSYASLETHRCLLYRDARGQIDDWRGRYLRPHASAPQRMVFLANSRRVLVDAALADGGIVCAAARTVSPLIKSGRLQRIVLPATPRPKTVLLVSKGHQAMKTSARVLRDHLVASLSTNART
jgi:LysR family transcriptional regulator for bpeEF and oprC